jgi:hypothetical protein
VRVLAVERVHHGHDLVNPARSTIAHQSNAACTGRHIAREGRGRPRERGGGGRAALHFEFFVRLALQGLVVLPRRLVLAISLRRRRVSVAAKSAQSRVSLCALNCFHPKYHDTSLHCTHYTAYTPLRCAPPRTHLVRLTPDCIALLLLLCHIILRHRDCLAQLVLQRVQQVNNGRQVLVVLALVPDKMLQIITVGRRGCGTPSATPAPSASLFLSPTWS